MAFVEEEDRKVFVGGLAQEATQEDLKEYFGKFGEIERVQLKMDSQTGRSRYHFFINITLDLKKINFCEIERDLFYIFTSG